MDLSRHYFIAEDLDELDEIQTELEGKGIPMAQVHVLTRDNAGLERHEHLRGVPSFMKRNMVNSALIGAFVGVLLALAVLTITYMAGWADSAAGWIPFLFLAIILLGFSTWFGGMHGLRVPNRHFTRFQQVLDKGKHVLFVDIDHTQVRELEQVIGRHPDVKAQGNGEPMPAWLIAFGKGTDKWWYWRMWRNV